jgi:predicted transcriptional regulator
MLTINRTLVLKTLIKHETLILSDIAKEENLGTIPDKDHLQLILDELHESGHIHLMDGVVPQTYTITDKGIKEGTRLSKEV